MFTKESSNFNPSYDKPSGTYVSYAVSKKHFETAINLYEKQNGTITSKLLSDSFKRSSTNYSVCFHLNGEIIGFLYALKAPLNILSEFNPSNTTTDMVLKQIKDYDDSNDKRYAIYIPFLYVDKKLNRKAIMSELHKNLAKIISLNSSNIVSPTCFATYVFNTPISESTEEREYCQLLASSKVAPLSDYYNTGFYGRLNINAFKKTPYYKTIHNNYLNEFDSNSIKKRK